MNKLYRFFWDCGRQGDLNGLFVANEESVKGIIGKEVYFGEVLGKHSDIHGTVSSEDIECLTDDQDFIEKALKFELVPIGFNPFEYLQE